RHLLQDRAVRALIAMAIMDEFLQRGAHRLQFAHLFLDHPDMGGGDLADIGTGAPAVLIERHQLPAILDGKAEGAGALEEGEAMDVVARIGAIAVAGALGPDQADLLVVTDGLGRKSGAVGCFTDIHGFVPSWPNLPAYR